MLRRHSVRTDQNNSRKKKKNGQSTVEYIILVAAVLGALLIFLGPNGIFPKAFNTVLASGTNSMTIMANRIGNSYQ